MRLFKAFFVGLIILSPFFGSLILPLSPVPFSLIEAQQNARTSKLQNNELAELQALQTILNYCPWMGETWQRLGRIQLDLDQYSEAVFSFDQAQKQGALTMEGMLWKSDALISSGAIDQANDQLRLLSSMPIEDPFLLFQIAKFQRSINDPYGALATLLKGYEIDDHDENIIYETGLLLSIVDPDKAKVFLEKSLENQYEHPEICEALLSVINQSATLTDSSIRYVYIGQVLSNYDEWDIAYLAFKRAVEIEPDNGVYLAFLAEATQQNGQDGTPIIARALSFSPEEEMVNGLAALHYRRQGKMELALRHFQKALLANPEALVWEIEMGNTYSEMGDFSAAIEHYQNAIKINLLDWTPWRSLAVFSISHNYDLETIGLPAARQALSLNEDSPALMDLLGTVLLMTGRLDEAEIYLSKAEIIDPDQSALLIHMGQLFFAQGEKEKAVEYLQRALEFAEDQRLSEMAANILLEVNDSD